MTTALGIGLVTWLLALAALRVYLAIARWRQWLDRPNQRSSHHIDTPSSGGIAFVLAFVLSLGAAAAGGLWDADGAALTALLLLVAVCVLGAVDDFRSLPVVPRLAGFALLTALLAGAYWPASGAPLLLLPFLVVVLTGLLNAFNFMDGTDGLAALQTLLCAAALGMLGAVSSAPPAFLGLCAACSAIFAAFLCFNWPPARLFMGDAGSLSAGFIVAWLGLWIWRDALLPLAAVGLLVSPFILDTGYTLLRRARRGERLTEAHREHLYQRLARHWQSHRRVALSLLGLHLLWLWPLSLVMRCYDGQQWTILAIGLFPQLFLIAKYHRLQ